MLLHPHPLVFHEDHAALKEAGIAVACEAEGPNKVWVEHVVHQRQTILHLADSVIAGGNDVRFGPRLPWSHRWHVIGTTFTNFTDCGFLRGEGHGLANPASKLRAGCLRREVSSMCSVGIGPCWCVPP